MGPDAFERKTQRLLEVLKSLDSEHRLQALLRILDAGTDGLRSSEAWSTLSRTARPAHLEKIRAWLLEAKRPDSKELVYSIAPHIRQPLQDVLDGLERMAAAKPQAPTEPRVVVMRHTDGFLVNGQPVESRHLSNTIKKALKPPREE